MSPPISPKTNVYIYSHATLGPGRCAQAVQQSQKPGLREQTAKKLLGKKDPRAAFSVKLQCVCVCSSQEKGGGW